MDVTEDVELEFKRIIKIDNSVIAHLSFSSKIYIKNTDEFYQYLNKKGFIIVDPEVF